MKRCQDEAYRTLSQGRCRLCDTFVRLVRRRRMEQVALGLFRNILGFMGDYQLLYPELLARDLIRECCHSSEIADEARTTMRSTACSARCAIGRLCRSS